MSALMNATPYSEEQKVFIAKLTNKDYSWGEIHQIFNQKFGHRHEMQSIRNAFYKFKSANPHLFTEADPIWRNASGSLKPKRRATTRFVENQPARNSPAKTQVQLPSQCNTQHTEAERVQGASGEGCVEQASELPRTHGCGTDLEPAIGLGQGLDHETLTELVYTDVITGMMADVATFNAPVDLLAWFNGGPVAE